MNKIIDSVQEEKVRLDSEFSLPCGGKWSLVFFPRDEIYSVLPQCGTRVCTILFGSTEVCGASCWLYF